MEKLIKILQKKFKKLLSSKVYSLTNKFMVTELTTCIVFKGSFQGYFMLFSRINTTFSDTWTI